MNVSMTVLFCLVFSLAALLVTGIEVRSASDNSFGDPKIVGGGPALQPRNDYVVRIQVNAPGLPSFICGGTLIHSDIVLTAAQCFREGANMVATIGASTVGGSPGSSGTGIEREISQMVPHPDYKDSFDADIMILKLSQETTGNGVIPVKYNKDATIPTTGQTATILGFGFESETAGANADELREASVTIADFAECNFFYQSQLDANNHICTGGGSTPGNDHCFGDGGGPLIIRGSTKATDVQVGIITFGIGCARPNAFSGYTKIAGYKDWISKQVCDLSRSPPFSCGGGLGICFSGSSTVDLLGKGPTAMSNLQIGDRVMVENNRFEPVYSFGHFSPSVQAEYLEIATPTSKLQVSRDHMVFVATDRAVPASMLRVGDALLDAGGDRTHITSIKLVKSAGAFAPFTPSGRVVVNGIVASSYVAFGGSESVLVGGFEFSFQWLAHSFQFPHRFVCYHLGACRGERYTDDGLSHWVSRPYELVLWLMQQQPVVRIMIFVPFVVILGAFQIADYLLLLIPLALIYLALSGRWDGAAAKKQCIDG